MSKETRRESVDVLGALPDFSFVEEVYQQTKAIGAFMDTAGATAIMQSELIRQTEQQAALASMVDTIVLRPPFTEDATKTINTLSAERDKIRKELDEERARLEQEKWQGEMREKERRDDATYIGRLTNIADYLSRNSNRPVGGRSNSRAD